MMRPRQCLLIGDQENYIKHETTEHYGKTGDKVANSLEKTYEGFEHYNYIAPTIASNKSPLSRCVMFPKISAQRKNFSKPRFSVASAKLFSLTIIDLILERTPWSELGNLSNKNFATKRLITLSPMYSSRS